MIQNPDPGEMGPLSHGHGLLGHKDWTELIIPLLYKHSCYWCVHYLNVETSTVKKPRCRPIGVHRFLPEALWNAHMLINSFSAKHLHYSPKYVHLSDDKTSQMDNWDRCILKVSPYKSCLLTPMSGVTEGIL